MSEKITFIIGGEYLCTNIYNILNKNNFDYSIKEAPYDSDGIKFVEIANDLLEKGTKIIISTGVNGQFLLDNVNIPVVLIKRSYYSFAYAIHEALRISSNISIVGRNGQYMETAKKNLDLFPFKIVTKGFDRIEEIPEIIDEIKAAGINVVIGTASALSYAQKNDMHCLYVPFEEIDIINAINEAKHHLKLIEENEKHNSTLKILLNSSSDGIIYLSRDGKINELNDTALKIIGESKVQLKNKYVDDTVLGEIKSLQKNTLMEKAGNEIIKLNSNLVNLEKHPIFVNHSIDSMILIFNKVDSIEKKEREIRSKLYSKGHVANKRFNDIIGCSKSIIDTISIAKRYAKVDSTVLILGNTGSGKEIFAQSIHNYSSRCEEPFVVINCGALPETILESELFGYEQGAFTGSKKEGKKGLFEIAHGGTVFLDEISEMPMSLQSRFLRVLQEKEVMPLGSNRVIPINVRVLAASNIDLEELVGKNKFREDLYYRISVLVLNVSDLSQRKEDIELLTDFFILLKNKELGLNISGITKEAISYLTTLDYPGNVRQLSNTIERAMVISNESTLTLETVKRATRHSEKKSEKLELQIQSLSSKEAEIIKETLIKYKFNRDKTAKSLGISKSTLWRKMNKYLIN
jgi:transcriptional regulator with PAS, ATPase and Fis domain